MAVGAVSARSAGQNAAGLPALKRIYVGSFGSGKGAEEMRRDLVKQLAKSKLLEVVPSAAQADAVLTGTAELWLRGYYSLNPRSGIVARNGTPLYDGSLSVELEGKDRQPIWSYMVTPRQATANVAKELGKELVKHLSEAVKEARRETSPD